MFSSCQCAKLIYKICWRTSRIKKRSSSYYIKRAARFNAKRELVWRANGKGILTETLLLLKISFAFGITNLQNKQTDEFLENDFKNNILLFEEDAPFDDPLDGTIPEDTSLCHKNHNSCKTIKIFSLNPSEKLAQNEEKYD